jgi:hypothetical protein
MLRICPHQDIKHTLLVSHLSELVTAHRDRHASRVHGRRSAAVKDRYAADTLHYCVDFGLDCELVWNVIFSSAVICEEVDESGLTSIRLVAAQWAGPIRGIRGS